jgi:hydroxyethylthiazole kinase
MDFVANSLLALGAAPLMSQSEDELEDLVRLSQSLYINLGTLDRNFIERAIFAAGLAKQMKKPMIIDPVGAGASRLRTKAAQALAPFAAIIRGNASEILALADEESKTRGVESLHTVEQAKLTAKHFARSHQKVLVVSGPVDFITDGSEETTLPFGSPLMPRITGMGCTLSALIAAFAGLHLTTYKASVLATAYVGLSGQQAFEREKEPGSYRQAFINALYQPNWPLFSQWSEEI